MNGHMEGEFMFYLYLYVTAVLTKGWVPVCLADVIISICVDLVSSFISRVCHIKFVDNFGS